MKKYNGQTNISGEIIRKMREEKKMSVEEICQKLESMNVSMNKSQLYRVEKGKAILKDFEMTALFIIFDIDFSEVKNILRNGKMCRKTISCDTIKRRYREIS